MTDFWQARADEPSDERIHAVTSAKAIVAVCGVEEVVVAAPPVLWDDARLGADRGRRCGKCEVEVAIVRGR